MSIFRDMDGFSFFLGAALLLGAAMLGAIAYSAGQMSVAHDCDNFGKFRATATYECKRVTP